MPPFKKLRQRFHGFHAGDEPGFVHALKLKVHFLHAVILAVAHINAGGATDFSGLFVGMIATNGGDNALTIMPHPGYYHSLRMLPEEMQTPLGWFIVSGIGGFLVLGFVFGIGSACARLVRD